jgi:hypothetical protein
MARSNYAVYDRYDALREENRLNANRLTREYTLKIIDILLDSTEQEIVGHLEEILQRISVTELENPLHADLLEDAKDALAKFISFGLSKACIIDDTLEITFVPPAVATVEPLRQPQNVKYPVVQPTSDPGTAREYLVNARNEYRKFKTENDVVANLDNDVRRTHEHQLYELISRGSNEVIRLVDNVLLPIQPPDLIRYSSGHNLVEHGVKFLLRTLYSIAYGTKQFLWRPLKAWIFSPVSTLSGIRQFLCRLFTEPLTLTREMWKQLSDYAYAYPVEFLTEFVLNIGTAIYCLNKFASKSIKDSVDTAQATQVTTTAQAIQTAQAGQAAQVAKAADSLSGKLSGLFDAKRISPINSFGSSTQLFARQICSTAATPMEAAITFRTTAPVAQGAAGGLAFKTMSESMLSAASSAAATTSAATSNGASACAILANSFKTASLLLKEKDEEKFYETLINLRMNQFRTDSLLPVMSF